MPVPRNKITGTAGNDTLTGSYLDDLLEGLAGDDVLRASAGYDTLDGGLGNNTADYGQYFQTNQYGTWSGINADLSTGRVDKVPGNTPGTTISAAGTRARYIRIYHSDASSSQWLNLTELQVWSGGVNVALGRPSTVGADGGVFEQNHNNRAALTDGRMGGAYDGLLTSGNLAWVRGVSGKAYIDLDLGAEYAIDSMVLSGRGDA